MKKIKPEELINELTYSSYRYNRDRSPHITPEQWGKYVFKDWQKHESRYQQERKERSVLIWL